MEVDEETASPRGDGWGSLPLWLGLTLEGLVISIAVMEEVQVSMS